jgi:hypothetical protein
MRRLIPPRRRPRAVDDRGAVAATLAIVLGTGVLLGMAAVVVDVGRLYAEREQLQSGADAAAWAVAEGCVLVPDGCADQAVRAVSYAADNAADGAADVTLICGRGPGLPDQCPTSTDSLTDCLGAAPPSNYVEVRTRTRERDGARLLPPMFTRALPGTPDGTSVAACARVAWGPPGRMQALGVTFSTCEWAQLTDDGTVFWPVSDDVPARAERVVYLKSATTAPCEAGPSGWDAPGGFGFLDPDDKKGCYATVQADSTVGGSTGNNKPCVDALADLRQQRRLTFIPIYETVRGNGQRMVYHLAGFASFVVTGYRLPGASASSWLTGRRPCGPPRWCLSGYFTRHLLSTTGVPIGGPDLGVTVVNLVG